MYGGEDLNKGRDRSRVVINRGGPAITKDFDFEILWIFSVFS